MKKIIAGVIAAILTSGGLFFNSSADGFLHVYFLNVGQGDSVLIRGPAGENIIIDSGPGKNVLPELADVLPFFDSGIDYAILTHPDRDHIEGFLSILKKYRVKHFIFTAETKRDYLYSAFIELVRQKNTKVTIANSNADLVFTDHLKIDILFPFYQIFDLKNAPANFCVIAKIIYGENEILLTGDAEESEENALLQNHVDLRADILKAGHHGSETSTSENFLKAVGPVYSVISVGAGNTYGHPHKSLLKRLKNAHSQILRTDRDGRIEFVMDKDKIIKIKTENG